MEYKYGMNTEEFILRLKKLKYHTQKRLLCIINTHFYLTDCTEYDMNFTSYFDFNREIECHMRNEIIDMYYKFIFFLMTGHTGEGSNYLWLKVNNRHIETWENEKSNIFKVLKIDIDDFTNTYECFKIGLKLKKLRKMSKKNFSRKSGLSLNKITQIEDYAFLVKISDLRTYVEKGLGKEFEINIF